MLTGSSPPSLFPTLPPPSALSPCLSICLSVSLSLSCCAEEQDAEGAKAAMLTRISRHALEHKRLRGSLRKAVLQVRGLCSRYLHRISPIPISAPAFSPFALP